MIPTIAVKTISAFAVILIVIALCHRLKRKTSSETNRQTGKFALQITKEDEGWGAAIINLKSKQDAVGLRDLPEFHRGSAFGMVEGFTKSRVFRSRIAAVAAPRYFRKGSEFEEVSLPYGDFPACEEKPSEKDSGDKYLKTVEATTRPVKWLAVWRPGIGATFRVGNGERAVPGLWPDNHDCV